MIVPISQLHNQTNFAEIKKSTQKVEYRIILQSRSEFEIHDKPRVTINAEIDKNCGRPPSQLSS